MFIFPRYKNFFREATHTNSFFSDRSRIATRNRLGTLYSADLFFVASVNRRSDRAQLPTWTTTQPNMSGKPRPSFYRRVLPNNLVDLTSPEGKALFKSALEDGNAEAFFPLMSQLQTQSHPALCGLTSLSTVLNALEIDPKRVWSHPWRWFAESLLICCMDLEKIKTSGITMDELACTASCQGSVVETFRGFDVDEARKLILRSVRGRPDNSFEFIVASYDRKSLGQTGSGHFSPIAAFDEKTDSVLVLDVARFKVSCLAQRLRVFQFSRRHVDRDGIAETNLYLVYFSLFSCQYGPHWVHLHQLVEATKPVDKSCGKPRGFLSFRKFSHEGPNEDDPESYQSKTCEEEKKC